MDKVFQIAIDGPSGAGKSTVAKLIATKLGIDYIDTGAMYRAFGLKMIRNGLPMEENDRLFEMLENTDIDFADRRVFLDGEDVSDQIRTQEVSKAASDCSAFKSVREKLVELQQGIGARKSVIMDGRDICSVVLKDAQYKYFLTAEPEERAKRRYAELREKGSTDSFEKVLNDINKRDYNDSHRENSPLKQTEDATLIDSTNMSIEEVVDFIVSGIK